MHNIFFKRLIKQYHKILIDRTKRCVFRGDYDISFVSMSGANYISYGNYIMLRNEFNP